MALDVTRGGWRSTTSGYLASGAQTILEAPKHELRFGIFDDPVDAILDRALEGHPAGPNALLHAGSIARDHPLQGGIFDLRGDEPQLLRHHSGGRKRARAQERHRIRFDHVTGLFGDFDHRTLPDPTLTHVDGLE